MFDFTIILDHIPELLAGAWRTLWISFVSIGIGFVLGHLLCFGKFSGNKPLKRTIGIYVSFFRGTPLLVQLAIIFYFLPLFGIFIPSVAAAIIALSMNTAAFQSEILRGGFQSLPKGQVEAAQDLGFSWWQIKIHIQIPQVFRATVPALVNESIDILKNSALISTIAVTDLMRISQTLASNSFRPIEFFLAAGVIYFVMTYAISSFGNIIEQKMKRI